jgi:hypothetical protein
MPTAVTGTCVRVTPACEARAADSAGAVGHRYEGKIGGQTDADRTICIVYCVCKWWWALSESILASTGDENMLQSNVLVGDRLVVRPWIHVDYEKAEILRVLERAASDRRFIASLTHHGPEAIRSYSLSTEAQAALLSGDIRWLEARVGMLDARLRTWPDCRLQQEIW